MTLDERVEAMQEQAQQAGFTAERHGLELWLGQWPASRSRASELRLILFQHFPRSAIHVSLDGCFVDLTPYLSG